MRLGDLLIHRGLVSPQQVQEALRKKGTQERLGQTLVRLGYVREDAVLQALSEQLQIPCADLSEAEIDAGLLTPDVMKTVVAHKVLPIDKSNGVVRVALSDPFDAAALEDLQGVFKSEVKPLLARAWEIERLIEEHCGAPTGRPGEMPLTVIEMLWRCREHFQAVSGSAADLRRRIEGARASRDADELRRLLESVADALTDIQGRMERCLRLVGDA